jgi:hypothetical protein
LIIIERWSTRIGETKTRPHRPPLPNPKSFLFSLSFLLPQRPKTTQQRLLPPATAARWLRGCQSKLPVASPFFFPVSSPSPSPLNTPHRATSCRTGEEHAGKGMAPPWGPSPEHACSCARHRLMGSRLAPFGCPRAATRCSSTLLPCGGAVVFPPAGGYYGEERAQVSASPALFFFTLFLSGLGLGCSFRIEIHHMLFFL